MKPRRLRVDLSGQTFGRLTAVARDSDYGHGKKPVVKWRCICDCGNEVSVKSYSLTSGHTVSCGCRKIKHMESYKHKTRLYNIWKCMKQRCDNPNNPSYGNYGAKGVSICPEWYDYSVFRDWAWDNGYSDELSIDRIDVTGNYEPANCRWADNKTQANNTRRNRFLNFRGEKRTMSQVADILGVSYSTIQHRVERGQPLEGTDAAKRLSAKRHQVDFA